MPFRPRARTGLAILTAMLAIASAARADKCSVPGEVVVTDPEADEVPANSQLDIVSVSVAEPYRSAGPDVLVFTIKVRGLDPSNLPLNAFWRASWIDPLVGNRWFVRMANCPSGVRYEYGVYSFGSAILGLADDGSYGADGSISIAIDKDKINQPQPGDDLTEVGGDTAIIAGPCPEGSAPAAYPPVDATGTGSYTLIGNEACAPTSASSFTWGRLKLRCGR